MQIKKANQNRNGIEILYWNLKSNFQLNQSHFSNSKFITLTKKYLKKITSYKTKNHQNSRPNI